LTSNILSQDSSGISRIGPNVGLAAALETKMSIPPK